MVSFPALQQHLHFLSLFRLVLLELICSCTNSIVAHYNTIYIIKILVILKLF